MFSLLLTAASVLAPYAINYVASQFSPHLQSLLESGPEEESSEEEEEEGE